MRTNHYQQQPKHMTTTKRFQNIAAAALLIGFGVPTMTSFAQTTGKQHYTFRRTETPLFVEPYNTITYTAGQTQVTTTLGDLLHKSKQPIRMLKISPAGNTLGIITQGKKTREYLIYSTYSEENRVFKFDANKYGEPLSAAYTPDARRILVATEKTIYIFEAKKYKLIDRIDLVPVAATMMTISPNSYFLAISDAQKVVVYNLEEKKIRTRFDLGEKVNEVTFSFDSSDMAVLTADGVCSIYDTRTFDIRKTLDDLGEGLACAFNFDGKYLAVAVDPSTIKVINLKRDSDIETIEVGEGGLSDLCFITDSSGNTLLAYNSTMMLNAKRMPGLEPFYARLISDEVDRRMEEWLKMMPDETMEQYLARVNDETREQQRRLFENEISTNLAGDLLGNDKMSLGAYDRANGVMAINFEKMPTIYLPVPESDISGFKSASDLSLSDVKYGLLPDDSFEIIYANVFNKGNGKTYTYDNLNRATMDFMKPDDMVSLEVIQQQQMEEVKLQELREKVVAEAKHDNIISDHTNITVDTKVVPDYDANGNKILNYVVRFNYEVEPGFSAQEDFAAGKYHVDESGAASSMLKIVKQALEGEMAQYVKAGKKLRVNLTGSADATPIVRPIAYDGSYGELEEEPVYMDGNLTTLTVTTKEGIKDNPHLAFLRALGVKDYLDKNINGFKDMNRDFRYNVSVSQGKGSEFRRITAEFTFVDVFE